MLSHSVISDSLQPHGLLPTRLLCPWDFPGKNTEVACHFLLQRIFPTQGSYPCLLCLLCLLTWQAGSLPLALSKKTLNYNNKKKKKKENINRNFWAGRRKNPWTWDRTIRWSSPRNWKKRMRKINRVYETYETLTRIWTYS